MAPLCASDVICDAIAGIRTRWRDQIPQHGVVHHPWLAAKRHQDSSVCKTSGEGLPLVAQRFQRTCYHNRLGQTAQVIDPKGTHGWVGPLTAVGYPTHHDSLPVCVNAG